MMAFTSTDAPPSKWYHVLGLTLLGLYANAAAYGFQYPAGADYSFFLPFANWFRDPSLYPRDPIRDVYPHVQTFYWPAVALLSKHFAAEDILFALFLLAKLIFFGVVSLLIAKRVHSRVLRACIVAAIALSAPLNGQTPIGGTIILDQLSEHAALALAMVLLAGVLLVEGKWRSAAIVAALSIYVDALQFLHVLPAFAFFAMLDWQKQKRRIVEAALLGAGVSLPWYVHFRRSFLTNYPTNYISALLIHYPLHITLRWTPVSQILEAAAILLAAACMGFLARRAALKTERRLELLALSYFALTLVGVLAGYFWLTPSIARFMLPRADSLLIPYAFLLIQIYGANLLESPAAGAPMASCLLAVLAILAPLYDTLPYLLLAAIILYAIFVRPTAQQRPQPHKDRPGESPPTRWENFRRAIPSTAVATGVCSAVVLGTFVFQIWSGDVTQLWNFHIPPDPGDTACVDAQLWARDHTPREAAFLVPPEGCGFRVFSQRSSWGEWSDGGAMYFDPAFAAIFLKRVAALDPAPAPSGVNLPGSLTDAYKNQPWDGIRAVATGNNLDYILQFSSTHYPADPVYANSVFAIYKSK